MGRGEEERVMDEGSTVGRQPHTPQLGGAPGSRGAPWPVAASHNQGKGKVGEIRKFEKNCLKSGIFFLNRKFLLEEKIGGKNQKFSPKFKF